MEGLQDRDLGCRYSQSSTDEEQANLLPDQVEKSLRHDSDDGPRARQRLASSLWWKRVCHRLYVPILVFIVISSAVLLAAMYLIPPSSTARHNKPVSAEADKLCTTWPVDEDGSYNRSAGHGKHRDKLRLDSHAPVGGWKKPQGIRIVGVIFYGRRRNVDILDCYLQQNLASHGGYLDEVRFLVHTTNQADLDFLDQLVPRTGGYQIVHFSETCQGQNYSCLWESLVEDDTIYIKIDDDIAYLHHDAIPQLVHTRIKQRHPLLVSANIINQPVLALEHFHFGAIHPFVAEPSTQASFPAAETWRPSEKPL